MHAGYHVRKGKKGASHYNYNTGKSKKKTSVFVGLLIRHGKF